MFYRIFLIIWKQEWTKDLWQEKTNHSERKKQVTSRKSVSNKKSY